MSKLSSLFPLIEKLTEKLSIIDNEWTKFKKSSDKTTHVTELSGILEILAQDGKALGESSGLESTVGTLTGAIKDLKKIEGSPPFEGFETLYTYSSKVSEYAEKFEKAFEKMSKIGYAKAKEAFSLIHEHSKKAPTGDDTPGMIAIIEKMKAVEGLDDLVKITTIADEELKPLLSKEFATFVKAAPDWTSIEPVQRSLDNTGLQNALKELSDNPVDLDLIDKMLKYGANIRQVQKGSIESLNSVLATLEEIKSGINQTKKVFEKATRHRRDVGDKLKKLKNSKSIAFDLAKGVNLLQSLATVYDRRDELVTAAEFPEIVNSALSSLPSLQSVWTENNRKALKEMPVELGKLEKYAQENQKSTDLIQIGSVFGKASEIKGAPIDNMLIRGTVVPALQKNSVLIIQNAASTLSKLGELELDFSKHSTRINAVTLTLPSLRDYFDEVFEISRTPKIVVAQDEKNDQKKDEAQSGLSIEMLGIIVGCIIVFLLLLGGIIFCIVRCRKRRREQKHRNILNENLFSEYNARLNDPETWVLLSFTAENTPNTFGSGFSIEAHKHIIKNNYDSFKKCLKNGAYVDAKLQTDKQSNTMLHEAVLHDKHKYVEALIKHGATREILNHEFETPMQLAVRLKKKKCIKMFKKYEHKKFKIVLPEVFTKNNYLIDVDRAIPIEEHYHGDFFKKFGQYQHEHPKRPTHYVAKTDKDNVLHVKDHHLPIIFSATMIMGHRWLKACLDNPSAIGNNKEWRVTKMSFRGKEYDTLLAIKDYINRMNVPYMFGIGVSYNNHTLAQEWSLMRTVTTQLGVYNGTGEFPFMCPKPGHCYHRDDLPRNFFLYHRNDKAQVQLNFKSTWMDNPAYLFMNTDDFTHFLLNFKIVSKKIEKIDKKNGVVKKKDEKNKRKDKLVSEESCSVTDCSDSCASTMSVGTPTSRTPTSGTPNSRTPNSVTPTSRTPGKNRRH
ncbi:hypothetical protein CRE_06232 [Caenorhabditis remanei]|uniref:Uncharacterized protein n=1 Tax=Caenorhabditis remanei TaxID=31234 RepID=E3NRV5_CAERE|nr:hypothetical protein CRE_06232 [Caenorhabditis remanei]